MPTQVERRETTRAALLTAARELFTEKGFAGTGREEIAERAGVTRGALYHHFASKQAAFEAVAAELDAELAARVVAAAGLQCAREKAAGRFVHDNDSMRRLVRRFEDR